MLFFLLKIAIDKYSIKCYNICKSSGNPEIFWIHFTNGYRPNIKTGCLYNIEWGYSSAGRVLDWQSRGHGFEPRYLHHQKTASEANFRSGLFFALLKYTQGTNQ